MAERKPAESRRRDIADAALKVIADRGLARFTSVAIAREVGVSDAALFRHFATKEDIVLAAIDRVEEILFEGFPPEDVDPIERLHRFFRRRIEIVRAHPGVARLVGSEQLAQAAPPDGVERVAEFRRRSRAFVRACLAEAHRKGLLAKGVDPEEATVLVLGALLALAHGPAGAPSEARRAEGVWALLERILRGAR
ncbi:MAG TPA: TetR/AcrR family transcriptional regulator [Anaeromyxobacteraceae bacterium]|nr:TetR/AcrR family transcriptional regulator [Anaeromyxobacteraceae bacterium]